MRFYLVVVLALSMPVCLCAQFHEWSHLPSIGLYYTPLKINRYSFSSGNTPDEYYYENSTNITLSAPLTYRFRLGVQYISIANKVVRKPVDRAFLVGAFGQYNVTARKRLGVYVQSGYTFGDLCPCGNAESYSTDTLNHFLEIGLGLDYLMTSRLHLKLGFLNYHPLRKQNDIYNWTQPFLGVNFYFLKHYNTPVRPRSRHNPAPPSSEHLNWFWQDDQLRRWNIGLTSSGISAVQKNTALGQTGPLLVYREFSLVPRLNYWVSQAVLLGLQGSYYHYENNLDLEKPRTHGFGVGGQVRFYPLNFKHKERFRAIRIGKRANWNISPVVGVEVHTANYSWLDPHAAGISWQYFDFQPFAGYVLSYKRWFNLICTLGPTLGFGNAGKSSPTNGVRIIGLEYNFTK